MIIILSLVFADPSLANDDTGPPHPPVPTSIKYSGTDVIVDGTVIGGITGMQVAMGGVSSGNIVSRGAIIGNCKDYQVLLEHLCELKKKSVLSEETISDLVKTIGFIDYTCPEPFTKPSASTPVPPIPPLAPGAREPPAPTSIKYSGTDVTVNVTLIAGIIGMQVGGVSSGNIVGRDTIIGNCKGYQVLLEHLCELKKKPEVSEETISDLVNPYKFDPYPMTYIMII